MFDTIRSSFEHRPKLHAKLDVRNSFITNHLARIAGVKVGLSYNRTVKLGFAYSWLTGSIKQPYTYLDIPYERKLRFQYASFYFEYAYYRSKKWELSIPIMAGVGVARYEAQHSVFETTPQAVVVYEPYMTAEYRFLKFLGVGFGMGYRLVSLSRNQLVANFNSPIYVLKGKVFVSDIVRAITSPKQGS